MMLYNTTCCSVTNCIQLFVTSRTAARQASLSFTISWSLLRFMSIESVMPSKHLILCRSLSCSQYFSVSSFPMNQLLTSGGRSIGTSALASVLPMNIQDWFPLGWAVQGTLKSLLQHHSSEASILWCSVFFVVQLSHPYVTTGKAI